MNAAEACALLGAAGFGIAPRDVRVEAREDRWAVSLPGDRMAWFPMNAAGQRRLATERRVLRLLADRCSFRAPRVLHEAEAGWDVRALVPGRFDPWGLYRRARTDRELARRIGLSIGDILAEQHACVSRADVEGWLPAVAPWPEPVEWMRARLPDVVDDPGLLAGIEQALRRYEGQGVTAGDLVLVHGDVGFHNIAVDPLTDELLGVFDYDGAAWADRHHDFCYLVFDHEGEDVLDGALEAYEPATGVRIDRGRVRLYNAACAISFLAYRRGVPPDARSCGRTLAEDVAWVRFALSSIGISGARSR
jgi:aminoglycoside phosphotransferase (APT) family kinase protein